MWYINTSAATNKHAGDVLSVVAEELGWKETKLPPRIAKDRTIHYVMQSTEFYDRFDLVHRSKDAWISRYPGMPELCNKVVFAEIFESFIGLFPDQRDTLFGFWPTTWTLPAQTEELKKWLIKKRTCIIKPEDGSQGDGIFLAMSARDVEVKMSIRSFSHKFVGQKYISNPLLIGGKKFDVRIYAICKSIGEEMEVFLCHEGLARFCTEEYERPGCQNLRKVMAHLTNYSLNKRSLKFLHSEEEGSKRLWSQILRTFSVETQESINQQIYTMVQTVMCVFYPGLHAAWTSNFPPQRYDRCPCFQVLGFDVLIDQDYKCHLMEVNNAPSFGIDMVIPVDIDLKSKDKLSESDKSKDTKSSEYGRAKKSNKNGAKSSELAEKAKNSATDGAKFSESAEKAKNSATDSAKSSELAEKAKNSDTDGAETSELAEKAKNSDTDGAETSESAEKAKNSDTDSTETSESAEKAKNSDTDGAESSESPISEPAENASSSRSSDHSKDSRPKSHEKSVKLKDSRPNEKMETRSEHDNLPSSDSLPEKICMCMDHNLPHVHQRCPVDQQVKSAVFRSAFLTLSAGGTPSGFIKVNLRDSPLYPVQNCVVRLFDRIAPPCQNRRDKSLGSLSLRRTFGTIISRQDIDMLNVKLKHEIKFKRQQDFSKGPAPCTLWIYELIHIVQYVARISSTPIDDVWSSTDVPYTLLRKCASLPYATPFPGKVEMQLVAPAMT